MRESKKSRMLSDSHRHAPKQEKALSKSIKGRMVVGSGSGTEKGDVRLEKIVRIEAKCTQHKSFSLKKELVDKMENIALQAGEVPVIQIDFLTDDIVDGQLAVIPLWALQLLINNQIRD